MPLLRRGLESALCALGAHHALRRLNRRRLLILGYHGVRDDADPERDWLLLPRGELERQLRWLAANYRCVTIDQAVRELRDGTLADDTACVTFDDGYRNNARLAAPLLRRYGIPATIYLTTDLVGTREMLWNTRMAQALLHTERTEIDLAALGLGRRRLGERPSRAALARQLCEALKRLPATTRARLAARLHEELGVEDFPAPPAFEMMSWAEVGELAATGLVTFGAHTRRHDILSRLDDRAVRTEVEESMRAVAFRVSGASATFAFPNGTPEDFDARSRDAVRRAGGVAALTTIEGLNEPGADPFALRRVVLGGEVRFDEFRLRAAGLTDLARRLRPAEPAPAPRPARERSRTLAGSASPP